MKKLDVPKSEAMIFRMLAGQWMSDRRVARILRCKTDEAYDRVKEIAYKRELCSVRIENREGEGQMIVVKPRKKTTILRFVSILPT